MVSLKARRPLRKRAGRARRAPRRPLNRLPGARFLPSPNHDARPRRERVSLLVVHAISLPPGEFGGPWIDRLFANRLDPQAHPYFETIRHLKVSAHACIFRDGSVTQYVPLNRRAWHAGVSRFDGRERCNDFSVGVELEGCDDRPFTDAQYATLARIARILMRRFPAILPSRIVGHSDIAPGRKTDPGPHFDWVRFRRDIDDA